MSENERPSSSSYASLINPSPTAEDYERYDVDRRIRGKARDIRVAQRSASSSARNSLSMTPEPNETSPTNDQYFTPKRESGGGSQDEEFVTPSTSKKDLRKSRRMSESGSAEVTPVSTKPPRIMKNEKTSDEQTYYTNCLSRKMEENFSKMKDLVFSGHSMQEAREKVLSDTIVDTSKCSRSPRRSSRITSRSDVIVDRSSSQPPPMETLNAVPHFPRAKSPVISCSKETTIIRTSYVDTLVAAHQMHMQYADRTVVTVEQQMTKLESMKNLAALSPAVQEAKRKRNAAEASRKLVETNKQREKKLEVISDLKDRIGKITNVQFSTHQLVSNRPFAGDPENEKLLKSLDGWVSLPFHEFDVQTARELQSLQKKMFVTINRFKNVASLHRRNPMNRSFGTSRKSIAMKIVPSDFATAGTYSDSHSLNSASHPNTREVSTQVTARLAETAMTQTSPRRVGVEPLDLSSLEKINSSSQTTPPTAPTIVPVTLTTEDFAQQTQQTEEFVVAHSNPSAVPTSTLSMTAATTLDIDEMLESIVLRNESLETLDSFTHFKSDISYPSMPSTLSADSTPRSERVSLDPESARRLSAGVSHFLEKIKKENESFEKENEDEEEKRAAEVEEIPVPDSAAVVVPSIDSDVPKVENISEESSETQSPPLNDESEVELNVDEHDITPFEHEMEEQEEQRRLRESALTPTPPRKRTEETVTDEYRRYIDPDDEEDETKKFVNNDEFERSLEEDQFDPRGADDSADDSGFLLNNKPLLPLKSIFDTGTLSPSTSPGLQTDTPRGPDEVNETTIGNLDMEDYCQKEYLVEIGPVMVQKAIEFQSELRGYNWVSSPNVWKPPSLEQIQLDLYDQFDYFDSYSILLWGAIVDLINAKYLKFGRKLNKLEEDRFEKEALEMLQKEYGPESKKKEWSKEVNMSKKLAGMMPLDLDYRFDVRRGLADNEKQKYQWQQIQMTVIAERYPRKKLKDELDVVYNTEKENLGQIVMERELEDVSFSNNRESRPEAGQSDSDQKMIGVSNV
ncbi:hypothetical protein GCK72_010322 [Caenorhabditis remanei]|uniref:Uncharacterized protein n=1 Tax=Caenorhabditis remanei TaxID=31234 RepID=A0A6A5H2K2_CAERE|nr:hypothetical protein GCK72_010322 [Caenorhabditis remanei]KAF1762060.1 hypothetical protein GCK72_010322 [Caenorhabditis remanei]